MIKDYSEKTFILDIDSTSHRQYGLKMEGLGYDYSKNYGLSSLQAFDQYGFQYWSSVRGGSAHTSVSSVDATNTIFSLGMLSDGITL